MNVTLALAAALLVAGTPLMAQETARPSYQRDVPASLAKEARISEDSARTIAAARVPRGTLRALELERERGQLIYSMELTVPGKTGAEEVNVDAHSGAILDVEHESAKQEQQERTAQ